MSSTLQELKDTSALSGANAAYIEGLYEQFLETPSSVSEAWQSYFSSLGANHDTPRGPVLEQFIALGKQSPMAMSAGSGNVELERCQSQVTDLINDYRRLGHLRCSVDPLGLQPQIDVPELALSYHKLSTADLNTEFDAAGACGMGRASLKAIIATLDKTYCGSIGAEIMHVTDSIRRKWLLKRFEAIQGKPSFSLEQKLRMLSKLIAAQGLEKYLGTKYVGQKRFSIEGGDTLIPMMDALTSHAASFGVNEIVVGMAHRGRLNMLVNYLGKAPTTLFDEFEGKVQDEFSGDVKYHKGFSSNVQTPSGVMHLSMAYNPSHLETVDPVVEGMVRAKQWRRDDTERQQVLPVLLHGDASFAGQGVVQETFNLSQVEGSTTGGTVHIVINNQIGFTTDVIDSRSTRYCTDIAKMVDAPILHVNGDDPEACVFALQLLYDYRREFKQDIVIDLVCYRRHGHNEADEPAMTQPTMYKVIKKHPVPYLVYSEQLQQEGLVSAEQVQQMVKDYRASLDQGKPVVEIDSEKSRGDKSPYSPDWDQYSETDWRKNPETNFGKKQLLAIAQKITQAFGDFPLQPQVAKLIANREKMAKGELPIDWGFAETLAYASLLLDGYPVRISGEDVQRGTFGHRHATLHNFETGDSYMPLAHLGPKQAPIWIYNSILSEYAVMGFELGYASACPESLVIWEAQFGDFANGAQIIVDQFLSSAEQKWKQKSGLVLFLPHGYEGQGPEHSSARLERYLQLCAQHNMQVCVPTTPAQVFHMLRRQMLRKLRKPLIVMTPKSMLRSHMAVSPIEDLAEGKFLPVIGEIDSDIIADKVIRVVMCSGKIYYDILSKRRDVGITNTAIVRIEQIYPFPDQELAAQLAKYPNAVNVVWTQEEPRNQGTWYSMRHNMLAAVGDKQNLSCISRPASAAPAGGYMSTHVKRQKQVVADALGIVAE
jgi:2-oxoglutarate dehydrogenase E1 component